MIGMIKIKINFISMWGIYIKKVLAVNSGSSSFKYKLFSLDNEEVIASGMADRVGLPGSVFTMTLSDGSQHDEQSDIANQYFTLYSFFTMILEN